MSYFRVKYGEIGAGRCVPMVVVTAAAAAVEEAMWMSVNWSLLNFWSLKALPKVFHL